MLNNVRRLLTQSDDFSYMDQGDMEEDVQIDNLFGSMRKRLAAHCYYMHVSNQLTW